MKKINILFLAAMMLFGFACDDQLELEPAQSLSEAESLADIEGLQTALFGAYDGLQQVNYYGREFLVIPEIEANLVYLSINNSNRFVQNYIYQVTVFNGDITGMWNDAYEVILRVNNIINNIDAIEGDQATKNQIKGEALAIRALAHFDLARYFGKAPTNGTPSSDLAVPIILEASISEPARNTVAEVYAQVIADLNEAAGLIGDAGIFRFGPDAVNALLARVYLYQGDYSNAVSRAAAVIGSGNYSLATDYVAMWAAPGSSEEIFTLRTVADENRGSDNLGGIYNPDTYGDIRVSSDWINLYEAGDTRAGLVYQFDDGEFYNSKYASQDGIPGLASPKLFRLGEMHLIRIEANFQLGNTAEALAELNTLRTARGASELAEISLMTIIEERQRELGMEGHTSFDLFRNNIDMVRTQCNTGVELDAPCIIGGSDNFTIRPIPQREIDVNDNMVQNPGY